MNHEFEFDGTQIEINNGEITVIETKTSLTLVLANLTDDLLIDARWNLTGCPNVSQWTIERMIYCFGLARRWIVKQEMTPA